MSIRSFANLDGPQAKSPRTGSAATFPVHGAVKPDFVEQKTDDVIYLSELGCLPAQPAPDGLENLCRISLRHAPHGAL